MKQGELNEDARRVIVEGRLGPEPGELVRARVRRSVAGKLARGAVAASLMHASSLLAAGSKLGIVLALAGSLGVGVWALAAPSANEQAVPLGISAPENRRGPEEPARTKAQVRPESTRKSPTPPATGNQKHAPRPESTPTRAVPRPPAAPAPVKAGAGNLAEEVALLADASSALNQGKPATAQALLSEYDQRFEHKLLVQERAASGVLVQCGLGNVPAAKRAARSFKKRWPRSPLLARLASSCAADAVGP